VLYIPARGIPIKKTKQLLDLARSWEIEYIKFSDLIEGINYK